MLPKNIRILPWGMIQILLCICCNSWSKEHTPSMVSKSLFYYLQSAGHFKNGSEYRTRRSDYDSMLLIYTIDGFGTLSYRNQVFLESGTVPLLTAERNRYMEPIQTES